MFDRFTDLAKRVLNFARQESQRLNHGFITPEHILLGLLRLPDSFGVQVLRGLGCSPAQIHAEVEKRAASGPVRVSKGQMPFTPEAKGVLEQSMTEAFDLSSRHIGTEHLLLGFFKPGDRHVAGNALAQLGITAQAVREIVSRHRDIDEDAGPVKL